MTVPKIEQLISQLEQQSEILNREIQCRKQAEFLAHQHIETLEAKNKEMMLFANIAVHNLREPLSTLEQNLFTLKNQNPTQGSASHHFIHHLEHGLSEMKNLLDYYRDHTAFTSENMTFTSTSIYKILENALNESSGIIETHHVRIDYDASIFQKCPPIFGDKDQLSAVIQQLISNAIQYRSEKPIQIEFQLEVQKGLCLLAVQDNGQGIDPKYFEQIFWFIKPDEMSGEYKRNSIGLAICKKVIEHHRGKMWVGSRLNQGSTFYILLPLGMI